MVLEVMLAAGATHIARGYTRKTRHLKDIFKEAIMHRGFSFVDVSNLCNLPNLTDYHDAMSTRCGMAIRYRSVRALFKIREWDYNRDAPIAIGTFYSMERPLRRVFVPPSGRSGGASGGWSRAGGEGAFTPRRFSGKLPSKPILSRLITSIPMTCLFFGRGLPSGR